MIDETVFFIYRARLVKVVDGDTAHLLVDHGMHIHSTQSIRLADVDTPELFSGTDRERGKAAREFAVAWYAAHDHHGLEWPFVLASQKDRQSFARYVGTVRCWDGHDLAADLIAAGHTALADPPNPNKE